MPPDDRRFPTAGERGRRPAKRLEQDAVTRRARDRAERLAVAELRAVVGRLRPDPGCHDRLAHRLAGMS
jgi:hypothetical protein